MGDARPPPDHEVPTSTGVEAIAAAPGRPKQGSTPSGGSPVHEATGVEAIAAAPGRPKQGSTPSGGSPVHEATGVGAIAAAPGRPKQGSTPSGGSPVHEATGVGASFLFWLSLAQLISWGSTFYLFGLLVQPMETELGINRAQSSLAFSLMLFAEGALAFQVGRWIDKGHARQVMSTCSALTGLCLLAHTQVTSLWGFYAVWTALGLSLSGVLYQPAFAVVTRRFPHDFRRAIITITFLGGLASTVFIPLILTLIDDLGWRFTLVILAGFHGLICLPVHFWLLRNEPKGSAHSHLAPTATPQSASRPPPLAPTDSPDDSLSVCLRNPVFLMIGVFTALGMGITAAIPPHLVPLLRERALPEYWVMLVPASIGVVQVVGRLLIFVLEHRFDIHRVNLSIVLLMPVSLLLLALLMVAGPSGAVFWGLAFAALFGLANGMLTIVKGTAIAEYVSRAHVASLNGALGLPSAIARAVAPLAIGGLWGISDNYDWGVALLVLMSVVSCGAFVQAQRLALRRKTKTSA